jgi:hypothetical protein
MILWACCSRLASTAVLALRIAHANLAPSSQDADHVKELIGQLGCQCTSNRGENPGEGS